jgi:hypothetical protein
LIRNTTSALPPHEMADSAHSAQTLQDELACFKNENLRQKLVTAIENEGADRILDLAKLPDEVLTKTLNDMRIDEEPLKPVIWQKLWDTTMASRPRKSFAAAAAGGAARPFMRPVASSASAPESGAPGEPVYIEGVKPWKDFKEATTSKAGNPLKLPHTVAARAPGWVRQLCDVVNLTCRVSPVTRDDGRDDTYVQKMSADESVLAVIQAQMSSVPGDYEAWVALGKLIAK